MTPLNTAHIPLADGNIKKLGFMIILVTIAFHRIQEQ